MAKVLATEVRAGNLIEWDKRVWRVLKSYHVHVGGRGGASCASGNEGHRIRHQNNQRFRTDEKIERICGRRDMEYLYSDGDTFIFMDQQNYEQLNLPAAARGPEWSTCCPTQVQVNFHNERPIGVSYRPAWC
jgi:elongation factor P